MSRRGRSGPTISLFSFQDIITSVTAIVTVITLLLALDLVQRKEANSSDSSSLMASELRQHLERSEAELAELQSKTDVTDELVRAVAATSPAELKNEIARRESAIVELQRERAKLEQQNADWQSREKEALSLQFDLEPLKNENKKTKQALSEIERQITEEHAENRVIFSLPRGTAKEGWLAVVDSRKISVAPLGRPARPVVFTNTGFGLFGTSAVDHFEKWFKEKQIVSAYFLLLVRPGGSATFDDLDQFMVRQSISHGFDLIDADQTVLHPERGAVP